MNRIRNLFVRAKHWQIFLLFVAIFVIGELPMPGYVLSGLKSPEDSAAAFVLVENCQRRIRAVLSRLFVVHGIVLEFAIPPALRLRIGFFSFTVSRTFIYVFGFIALFSKRQLDCACRDNPAAAGGRVLHALRFLFPVKKPCYRRNGQERDFQRICRAFFPAVVLPHRDLVYPAADQPALR
jgi:hypothetical protein